MEKTFDGIVDGKHVQKWRLTDEEKAEIEARKAEIEANRPNHVHNS